MRRPGRRTTLVVVAGVVVVALAAGVVALVLARRGPGPDEVASDYLRAQWTGDARTECELSAQAWQHLLFEGHPFADCAAFAAAADEAATSRGLAAYADDTDIQVAVETTEEDDGEARVSYALTFRYHGEDRAGFDALWQGADPVDRGTVLLSEGDDGWLVAGVDPG